MEFSHIRINKIQNDFGQPLKEDHCICSSRWGH